MSENERSAQRMREAGFQLCSFTSTHKEEDSCCDAHHCEVHYSTIACWQNAQMGDKMLLFITQNVCLLHSDYTVKLYQRLYVPSTCASLQACTWGVAYEVTDSQIEGSLQYLHIREVMLGGYILETVEFFPKEKGQDSLLALVYIATSDNPIYLGPASEEEIAAQIAVCRGNSGSNIEYLVRLAEFMRLYCPEVEDEHLFSIEAAVLNIFT